MNGKTIAGIALAVLFALIALQEPSLLPGLLGSALAIWAYLRARKGPAPVRALVLWAASAAGAVLGGVIPAIVSGADLAFAAGAAVGAGLVLGIPLAAAVQLVLTGRGETRPCPNCSERIKTSARVCRHCRREVQTFPERAG